MIVEQTGKQMIRYFPKECDQCKHHRWNYMRSTTGTRRWIKKDDYCCQSDDGYTNDCLLP